MKELKDNGAEEVIKEILKFIDSYYYSYDSWYVGVSDEPEIVLSNKHMVNVDCDPWIEMATADSSIAEAVKRHLMEKHGTDGDMKQASVNDPKIYAYKKNRRTRP